MIHVYIHAESRHNPDSFSLARAYFREYHADIDFDPERLQLLTVDDRETKLVYIGYNDDKDTMSIHAAFYSTTYGNRLAEVAEAQLNGAISMSQLNIFTRISIYHNGELIRDTSSNSLKPSQFAFRRELDLGIVMPRGVHSLADVCYDPPQYLYFLDAAGELPLAMPDYKHVESIDEGNGYVMRVFKNVETDNGKGLVTVNYALLTKKFEDRTITKIQDLMLGDSYRTHNSDMLEAQIDNIRGILNAG